MIHGRCQIEHASTPDLLLCKHKMIRIINIEIVVSTQNFVYRWKYSTHTTTLPSHTHEYTPLPEIGWFHKLRFPYRVLHGHIMLKNNTILYVVWYTVQYYPSISTILLLYCTTQKINLVLSGHMKYSWVYVATIFSYRTFHKQGWQRACINCCKLYSNVPYVHAVYLAPELYCSHRSLCHSICTRDSCLVLLQCLQLQYLLGLTP
jgi:hypothetical protein